MRVLGIVAIAACGVIDATGAARADATCVALDAAWPRVTEDLHRVSIGTQITDQLTELGNELGHHMHVLSHDLVSIQFDGRQRRAKVKVGAGDDRYVSFSIATDIKFEGGLARVKTTLDFSVQGKRVTFDLPEFAMMPQSYQGDRVVVLLVPVVERRW
ncbi:MAG: hypothetical protein NT062_33915 [Proteobacteria bacterium]|nr:hypothetical protein [Pseudomonadota bacterium]